MKKFLKPIFDAIAKPGIIGPHTGYEADLMLAGVKPLGVFWKRYQADEVLKLDKAAEQGFLIRGEFTRPVKETYHFYTLPGKENEACNMQRLVLEANWNDDMPEEEKSKNLTLCKEFKLHSPYRFEAGNIQLEQAVLELTRGVRSAISLLDCLVTENKLSGVKATLDEAVAKGTITCTKKEISGISDRFIIYGQHGQEDNMKELARTMRIYFDDSLPEKYNSLYEGRLLGFTENDVRLWANGPSKAGSTTRYIMEHTNSLRRWCRVQSMLMDAPRGRKI